MTIKYKIIIALTAVIAATSVITYTVILPTVHDIKQIKNSISIERLDLEKKYLRGQLLNKVLEDFEKTKAQKGFFADTFITEDDELSFVTALEQIADDHQVVQSLQLESGAPSAGFNKQSRLNISIQGSFQNVLSYLQSIDQLSYYYNIDSLVISPSDIPNTVGGINVGTSGLIFTIPAQEKI
jgi:hypothetical protein